MLKPEKCPSEVNFGFWSMLNDRIFIFKHALACSMLDFSMLDAFENRQILAKIVNVQSITQANALLCRIF